MIPPFSEIVFAQSAIHNLPTHEIKSGNIHDRYKQCNMKLVKESIRQYTYVTGKRDHQKALARMQYKNQLCCLYPFLSLPAASISNVYSSPFYRSIQSSGFTWYCLKMANEIIGATSDRAQIRIVIDGLVPADRSTLHGFISLPMIRFLLRYFMCILS